MKNILMKSFQMLAVCFSVMLTASCSTAHHRNETGWSPEQAQEDMVLFEDSMTANWQDNWFLDGKRATLDHRDGGLAFLTTASNVDKRVDRIAFDAQHAVLWTRQEFEGDIRISYTYTKLPDCSWQKLIYVQAQGIGEKPYVEDIYTWRDLREVSIMSSYFNHMNLIGLSLRDEIRCKRYPWSDLEGSELKTEFMPRAVSKGMPEGRAFHCLVEKRKKSISLRITDAETGEPAVDHIWDLTDEEVLEGRNPKFIEKGRIGIRLMGGHKILMRDFKVEHL